MRFAALFPIAVLIASCGSSDDSGSSNDSFSSDRDLCLSTINQYRATRGLPAYAEWNDESTCADGQAQSDAQSMSAHGAFIGGDTCSASAQTECPGYGADVQASLPQCLQLMWSEKDRPQCAGCDTCDAPFDNCTDCTFLGTNGSDGCGHYLSLKSSVFTEVACGFSTSSAGWYLQDYH